MLDEDELSTACEVLTDELIERFQVKDEEKDKQSAATEQAKGVKTSSMCPICLEALSTSKLVCKLPCRHMFHSE